MLWDLVCKSFPCVSLRWQQMLDMQNQYVSEHYQVTSPRVSWSMIVSCQVCILVISSFSPEDVQIYETFLLTHSVN